MELDLRTRTAADIVPVDPDAFCRVTVPELLEQRGELAARAFAASGLRSIAVGVDGSVWTWRLDGDGHLEVVEGDTGDGARADLPREWFADIVNDVRSTVAVMIGNAAEMVRGNVVHLIAWEPVLRALTDGRAAYEAGLVGFEDRDGGPLDLHRSFTLDDDPAEVAHFLGQAGFLHVRGVFTAAEMDALSAEIDRWRGRMTPGDDRAWYARSGDEQVCVRVTNLARGDVRFPHAERLQPVADMVGAGHRYAATDLLVKPVGVTEGISDLPWHKDCALGLHSYNCTSMTCGVSVTGSGPDNGQLGVLAGSHRVNIPMFDLSDDVDLPVVWLETDPGDVTVHLSCALHCATPPRVAERRVTYSALRLPGDRELEAKIRAVRDQAGRDTYAPR